MGRSARLSLALSFFAAVACGEAPQQIRTGTARSQVVAPIAAAFCEAQVDGVGMIDVETDYLPHVVSCENGGADLEALKAQAIAARSVLYYALETNGSICDGQGCQVYSCGNDPLPIHQQAVDETSGIYLAYNDTLTYGFYVAGDNATMPPDCIGQSGSTENFVTYNEGLTGTAVEQTTLGFIFDPSDFGYGQNRGCMGQWGARCLEANFGYAFGDILKFYYGDDIGLLQASGPCILEGEGGAGGSAGGAGAGGEPSNEGGSGAGDEGGAPSQEEDDDGKSRSDASCSCSAPGGSGDGMRWLSALWLAAALGFRRRRAH